MKRLGIILFLINSILFSQEFDQPLNLKKGDNRLEIKKGDQIYVRSYDEGLFNN